MWFSIHGDFFGMRSWKDFILQLSSAPSHASNQKRVDVPLGDLLVFTVRDRQAIENKDQNHLIDKVQGPVVRRPISA